MEENVLRHMRTDFTTLQQAQTVQQALDTIRAEGVGGGLVYFYVVDASRKLVGVLPTRRLLTAPADKPLSEIMVTRVLAIPSTATLLEACELFAMHRLLAFPVVDEQRHIVGVVDVNVFTEEMLDLSEEKPPEDIFEALGFHLYEVRDASPLRAFRFRFPWLLVTISGGTVCAILSGAFAKTLEDSIVLAFFFTMVLGLAESVSMQSMTVTIQALRSAPPTRNWYWRMLNREIFTAAMLGLGCGIVVFVIVWFWRSSLPQAVSIGVSISGSLFMASLTGLTIPSILHAWRLDPKIAAGPIALALTDMITVLIYFVVGTLLLER